MGSRRTCTQLALLSLVVATIGLPIFCPSLAPRLEKNSVVGGRVKFSAGEIRTYSYVGEFGVTLHDLFIDAIPNDESHATGEGRASFSPSKANSRDHFASATGGSTQRTKVTGTLFAKVFSASDTGAFLGLQLTNVSCPDERIANPRCVEVYQAPLLVKASAQGEIEFVQFSNTLALSEERKVKGLFESLSLQVQDSDRWQAQAKDSQGTAVFTYSTELNPLRVNRKKIDYLEIENNQQVFDRGEVTSSEASFTLSKDGFWLDAAEITETSRFTQEGKPRLSYTHDISLSANTGTIQLPSWASFSEKEFRAYLMQGEKRVTSRSEEERAKRTTAILKGDPKGLQKRLSQLGASQSPSEIIQSAEALRAWLAANPEKIATIPSTLQRSDLNDDVRSRIVYALQKVGGERAELALFEIAADKSHSNSTRRAALGAFNFMNISPAAENALWEMREGTRLTADSPEDRALFQEMATLALGGAARALSDGDLSRASAVVSKLTEALNASTQKNSVRDIETLLMALGNSSHEEATPLLIQYLSSNVDGVRAAAVTALQSSEQELPLDTIIEAALKEEHPGIRAQFVALLHKSPVSEYSFAAVMQLFLEEDDRSARIALAEYLSRAGSAFPAQRHHIRALLRTEQDPIVAKALGTRKP